jgi:putative protease
MIEHIPELIESGISSFKIEGRMKGINYLASTVKVYREAIDAYYDDPAKYYTKKEWIEELASINNRDYCSGFYFGDPDQVAPNYVNHKPLIGHLFVGKVIKKSGKMRMDIEVRNKIFKGDLVEVVGQKGPPTRDTIKDIIDPEGQALSFAQPGSKVTVICDNDHSPNDLIRRIGNSG